MTSPRQAQLDLLLTISEGLSRGSHEMLRVSPTDAMHAPSCGLAIRDAVEELRWMRAEVERLTGKLKLVADALNDTISKYHEVGDQVDRLDAENGRLRAEIERLRAALSWYADPRNHFPVERRSPGDPDPAVVFVEEPPIMRDGGKRAREALEVKP